MDLNFRRSQNRSDQPLGSRYKIVDKLGEGGFGQTFKAQDLHLPGHPLCVVKQLKPQVDDAESLQVARRLFDTEARVLYQLGSHPQIPHLLAHFEQAKEFYLAQELIEGHSLADEFETVPWDVPKVVNFLGDLLKTLAFVHEHRVIHRDLKPSNLIRRSKDNRIVLIDFGAVKQAGTQPAGSSIVKTISIGTQGYMPSEQLAGQPQFSSDVYAVGIMGIQALTGQPPKQLLPNAHTGELDWRSYVPHIPLELITILDTMVRYDFRARYPSAKEALNALQTLPKSLGQYVPRNGAAAVPVAPTGLTVPVSAPPPNRPKTSIATEVVSAPPTTTTKIPAIIAGLVILAAGLLIGRACTSAGPDTAETQPPAVTSQPTEPTPVEPPVEITEPEPTEPPAAVVTEPVEPPEEEITEPEPTEPPEEEIVEPLPAEPEPPEEPENSLDPATAQAVVTSFYNHLSNRSWAEARAQTSENLARQFDPNFFQQFQQISVENLRIRNQTPQGIEFVGQNTYTYNDGSTQKEARTFTVALVDGQPRIVDSKFVRVIKAR